MNRDIDFFKKQVDSINDEYATLKKMTNDELRNDLWRIQQDINVHKDNDNVLDEYLVKVFAIVKETARRLSIGKIAVRATLTDKKISEKYDFIDICGDEAVYKNRWDVDGVNFVWNMVHYDEQVLCGILLHHGYAAEMATGEGKTLAATLPIFLNALSHKGVHLMTANSYLSNRDFELTRPIYMFYGLSVDCIENFKHEDERRKNAYRSDIIFGTHSSFTFDYLYDHLTTKPENVVQSGHNYAIIDEIDSILIDDAATPHIVGGGRFNNGDVFKENFPLIEELVSKTPNDLFESNKIKKESVFTESGKKWLASKTGISDLFLWEHRYEVPDFDNLSDEQQKEIDKKLELQNVFYQLLNALTVYEKDVDYVIENGMVKIIDENTGRIREDNRWEHGLHTAIEVKEGVNVQNDFNSMAVISLKNYFRMYKKVAGMSGTILQAKGELNEIYGLRCASVPTHKPCIRVDMPLRVFKTKEDKDAAIINSIAENHNAGRPTLVGCPSIKQSEEISGLLDEYGVRHQSLNAKTEMEESQIIATAGIGNTITVSTSMAGRGTDIKPSEDAIRNGGLFVIGTEFFVSQRIDRQLAGRSGRQGNPGSSLFFASMDDAILNYLSGEERVSLETLVQNCNGQEISEESVRQYFKKAQRECEIYRKNSRKNTARKDDIIDPLRREFYKLRDSLLFSENVVAIVGNIFGNDEVAKESVYRKIHDLYRIVCEIIRRSRKNNVHRTSAPIPFSENRSVYTIEFEIVPTLESFEYFSNVFLKNVIFSIYDREWKHFVLYMMGNLDSKEIDALDGKYEKMTQNANSEIIEHLKRTTTIPVDIVSDVEEPETQICGEKGKYNHKQVRILPNDKCPCGSGKKFCECHGAHTRRTRR